MNKNSPQKGFIKTVILIIIGLILLKYVFHISLSTRIDTQKAQMAFSYLYNMTIFWFNAYFLPFFAYIWNHIIMEILWPFFQKIISRIKPN